MTRRYSLVMTTLLLVTIGWLYYVSGGSPVSYLRSFVREDPPNVQELSADEFRKVLKRTERRHGRHEPTSKGDHKNTDQPSPPEEMVVDPDTTVRRRWKDRFSSSTRDLLREMDVTPATPKFGQDSFSARDLSGDTQSSRRYRGEWVLVNFWATWCLPCREEMPSLNQLNQRFPDSLSVVAVNVGEDPESVRKFRKQVNFDFSVWMDSDRRLTRRFGTRRLPETWVVDPDGRFLGVLQGPREWTREGSLNLFRVLTSS